MLLSFWKTDGLGSVPVGSVPVLAFEVVFAAWTTWLGAEYEDAIDVDEDEETEVELELEVEPELELELVATVEK